jgi:hypothetical protein
VTESSSVVDLLFVLLEQAASEGRRCPTNPDLAKELVKRGLQFSGQTMPRFMKQLTHEGRIIVRLYRKNWRDVVICSGPHSGKATKPPPRGGKPHTLIDTTGRKKGDGGLADWIFVIVEQAASEGRRCPTNPSLAKELGKRGFRLSGPTIPRFMKQLAREGRIIVRVYGNNWRDVVICGGPHAGKATMPPPHGGKPHTLIDATGHKKL